MSIGTCSPGPSSLRKRSALHLGVIATATVLALLPALAIAGAPAPGLAVPASAVVGPIPGQAGTGAQGTIFTSQANSIAGADTIIATSTPAGSWRATNINYLDQSISTPLSTWFGADAPSLQSLPGSTPVSGLTMVVGGLIAIPGPGSYTFTVSSDDGMRLRIGGVTIVSFDGDRGFSGSTNVASFSAAGLYPIDLLYWANASGSSGLRLEWVRPNESVPSVVPGSSLYLVPTPGAISVLALGGLIAGRRRR
jgi:hypothetical protein